mgnify:CR=1 FL=1
MAKTVSFDFKNVAGMASAEDIAAIKEEVVAAKSTLVNKTGEGNDFLGWIDLPVDYDKEEFARIKKAAAKIQSDSGTGCHRYRRFLPWRKSSDRSFKTQLL